MKQLTRAQSELIDAFLAEYPTRASAAQLEKDFLISEAFSIFSDPVEYDGHAAEFVLCGGTAVSKVYRYTERMSEDIDLRVGLPDGLSQSAERRFLRHVKAEVLRRLRKLGFRVSDEAVNAANQNRYMAIPVQYESVYPTDYVLRSELLVEISARAPLLEPVTLEYDTIINQILKRKQPAGRIRCLDIRETLAGKNAALLRRWSAHLHQADPVFGPGGTRSEDIVRHIYDLGRIFEHSPQYVTAAESVRLAHDLLLQDAQEFGGQDAGFKQEPIKRALEALHDLSESETARSWYQRFTTAMVYGEIPAFDAAMRPITQFSEGWSK